VSAFRQRIESPAVMLTVTGEKAVRLIWTTFVVAALEAGASSSAAARVRSAGADRLMGT
jgi:hypothetical protein